MKTQFNRDITGGINEFPFAGQNSGTNESTVWKDNSFTLAKLKQNLKSPHGGNPTRQSVTCASARYLRADQGNRQATEQRRPDGTPLVIMAKDR